MNQDMRCCKNLTCAELKERTYKFVTGIMTIIANLLITASKPFFGSEVMYSRNIIELSGLSLPAQKNGEVFKFQTFP